jgi:hypothetical protein
MKLSDFRKRKARADQTCLQDVGKAFSSRPVYHWIGSAI